jgi:hypothetical protein
VGKGRGEKWFERVKQALKNDAEIVVNNNLRRGGFNYHRSNSISNILK